MTIEAQLPGGTTLQFPDGTPDAIVQGAVKQQLSTQPDSASQTPESKLGLTPAPETKPPADAPVTTFDEYGRPLTDGVPPSMTGPPVTAKGLVDAGVRGVGLGTRATVEGLSGLPAMAADAVTWPARAAQRAIGIPTQAPSDMLDSGLTAAGLPKPETTSERLTSATVSGVASVLPTIAAGGVPALIRAYPTVANALAERLLAQAAAGGASAGSQEETRQLGGGPIAQFGVGTLAGLLAAHAVSPNTLAPSPGSGPRFIQEYFGEGTPTNPLAAYPPKRMPAFVPPGTNLPPEPLLRQPQPIQEGTVTPQGGPPPSPQEPPAFVPPKAQRPSPLAPTVAPDGTLAPPQLATPGVAPRTSAEAKQVAGQYYTAADNAGGTLTPQFTNKFIDSVGSVAPQTEAGAAVTGTNAVTSLVDRLQSLRDKPMTLQAAQEVDEGLSNLIDKEYGVTGLSKDGKKLLDIQGTLRDQINNAGSGDTSGGTAGFDALNTARQAWSQAMKMGDLERIQERAALTDNPATSIRTQVRNLITNQSKSRGYTPDEIAALTDAANRGTLGGLLHVFGSRLVPIAAGAAGLSHGPAGMIVGAGLSHVGTGYLRDWATNIQQNRLGNAIGVVGQGVPPPVGPPWL